jgi:hypothetical protein
VANIHHLELAAPMSGTVVHGVYPLDVVVPSGVTKVEFDITGGHLKHAIIGSARSTLIGSVDEWDSARVANGTYSVRATALNAAGTRIRSKAVRFTVAN